MQNTFPILAELQERLRFLTEKTATTVIKNLTDNELEAERSMVEQSMVATTNATETIMDKVRSIEIDMGKKQLDLQALPLTIVEEYSWEECTWFCLDHPRRTGQRVVANPAISTINNQIATLNKERLDYLLLADESAKIFNKGSDYFDRLNAEIRNRQSIIAQIPGGDIIQSMLEKIKEAISIPEVIKPYLPIVGIAAVVGGIILLVRRK